MWAQDAAAMYGYAGASASATALTPFTPAPQSTNPGGLGDQAGALTQATATSAATNTPAVLSQLTSAVPTTLSGLASPGTSTLAAAAPTSGIFGILQDLGLISPSTILEPSALGLGSGELTTASGAWADAAQDNEEIKIAAAQEIDSSRTLFADRITGLESRIMNRFDQLGAVGSVGTAGLGQAGLVGGLSVPPGWAAAAPEIRLAALALPAASLGAAPEVFAGSPGSLFSEMTLASMAGRAISGTASSGCRERIGATTRARLAATPTSPSGPMTGIAAEIREFAELLGKLGDLRDSGLLTDEEFNKQKERLLAHC
jgi:PPE-repeat protein